LKSYVQATGAWFLRGVHIVVPVFTLDSIPGTPTSSSSSS
jgi:hypothetical protein